MTDDSQFGSEEELRRMLAFYHEQGVPLDRIRSMIDEILGQTPSGTQVTTDSLIAAAIGEDASVVARDIAGRDIIHIGKAQIIETLSETSEDPLTPYLSNLANKCNMLELHGIDATAIARGRNPVRLDQIYVNLDVGPRRQELREAEARRRRGMTEERLTPPPRRGALEVIGQKHIVHKKDENGTWKPTALEPKMIILGDPGSGKSTFINYLALCLASERLKPGEGWLRRLEIKGWTHGKVMPIRFILRDFARSEHFGRSADSLWRFFVATLGELQRESEVIILEAMKAGDALLLFDGVDELPAESRKAVSEAILDMSSIYNSNRFILTCREVAYHYDDCWDLPDFEVVTLQPFSDDQIDEFVDAWYTQVRVSGWNIPSNADIELKRAVRSSGLIELARSPLLLTQMALLHGGRGTLPDDRVELYREVAELLLSRWGARTEAARSLIERLDLPGLRMSDLESALWEVAFCIHRDNAGRIANIPEPEALRRYSQKLWIGDRQKAAYPLGALT